MEADQPIVPLDQEIAVLDPERRGAEVDLAEVVRLEAETKRISLRGIDADDIAADVEHWQDHGHFHRRVAGLERQRQALLAHLRSEEHTSELQSIMRLPYAAFRLKKNNTA